MIAMGNIIQQIMEKFFTKKDSRLLMIGLASAGKTTILFKLKLGEIV